MNKVCTTRRVAVGIVAMAVVAGGCSGPGGALSAAKVGMNLMKGGSHVRVSLDGQEAKQSTIKKAIAGHSNWEVKESVSTSPTVEFRLTKPEKFGRITFTAISIFQEYEGDYSGQAEFAVVPRDNKPESQLKPETPYDLGKPPEHLKVLDLRGNEVKAVQLIPGKKYKLSLTIRGDDSETADVHFKTK